MTESLRQRNEAFLRRLNRLPIEPNPALMKQAVERAASVQNRIADAITDFAGSMWFVYIHIVWFGLWIGLGAEKYPYGLLTMIVSLEAIFLSCFVLVSQNRQAQKDRVRADVEYEVNVRAEREVSALHAKSDRLYEQMMARLREIEKRIEREPVGS